MEETSLSYKTLRNSGYLFAGFILPMLFTVFVTRALVKHLGVEEFGIYLLVNSISSFVIYVDLGLSTAVTKYVAEYQARGDLSSLHNILSSARILFFAAGLLGLIIFLVLGRWFLPLFHIPEGSANNFFIVFALAGLVFFLNSAASVYNSVLNSLQRFDLFTKLSLANLVFVSIGSLILLHFGFQLKAIMALNVLATGLCLLVSRHLSRRLMPQLHLSLTLDKPEIKKAYKFGFLTFISSLAVTSLVYFDRLLIPIFAGPSQLSFYSVPGNVALKTSGVTNSLGGMLFPMTSALAGIEDTEKLYTVYTRAFRNLSLVAAAITVAIILFARKILFFWLGSEYAAHSTHILVILAVTYYLIALYIPLQSMLLGMGQVKYLVKQSLAMAGINIVLLFILVPRFGIIGAAWAYLISVLPIIFAFYWSERKIFHLGFNRWRYHLKLYARLGLTALVDGCIIHFILQPLVNNVWALVVVGPLSVLLFLLIYYVFGFTETEDIELIKTFMVKFFRLGRFNKQ